MEPLGVVPANLGLDVEVVGPPASLVDEELRQRQVPIPPGEVVKLHQCQLDLLVTGISALLTPPRAENLVDVVRVAAHHVEELSLGGGLVVCDGGLDEMPRAV